MEKKLWNYLRTKLASLNDDNYLARLIYDYVINIIKNELKDYEKLKSDYDIVLRQYRKRGNIVDKMIKDYNLPKAEACLD